MPDVKIYEVGLRDGIQSLPFPLPTGLKAEMAGMLAGAGLKYIEIGSFVSPKAEIYKNFVDTAEVFNALNKIEGVEYAAFVPNLKYYEQAVRAGIGCVSTAVSANEEHNKKNLGKTRKGTLDDIAEIIRRQRSRNAPSRFYISTAFGYRNADDTPVIDAVDMHESIINAGGWQDDISVGDTFGMADVRRLHDVINRIPGRRYALHLHQGSQDKWEFMVAYALGEGITSFDSSIGGYGGCPTDTHIRNIPTEKLVSYLEKLGVSTGIDADEVWRISEKIKTIYKNHK